MNAMADFTQCPRCRRFVGPDESTCSYCGQSLAVNPLHKLILVVGAAMGAADGAAYGALTPTPFGTDFTGGLWGGMILGALVGALVGAIVHVMIVYPIVKWVLTLRHGRKLLDGFATEQDRAMRDWVVLWRAKKGEVWVATFVAALLVQAAVVGAYLYFRWRG
jgi:hypothetical protein